MWLNEKNAWIRTPKLMTELPEPLAPCCMPHSDRIPSPPHPNHLCEFGLYYSLARSYIDLQPHDEYIL